MPSYDYQSYPSSYECIHHQPDLQCISSEADYSSYEYQYDPPSSFDPNPNHRTDEYSNREAVISSLMEKLADRDAEIRDLRSENSNLKNELVHCVDQHIVEELERDCKSLTEMLRERDEELRAMARDNDDLLARQRELEMTCNKLTRAVDAREADLTAMENELHTIRDELKVAADVEYSKNRDLCTLGNQVEDLQDQVEHYKAEATEAQSMNRILHDREAELKSILKDNDVMLQQQEKEISVLSRKTRGLEYDADVQSTMLEEQEQDVSHLKRIILKLNDVIESQEFALGKKDEAIMHLTIDIERYEQVAEEAEHNTYGQREQIRKEMEEREKMMGEIEKLKDELDHERSGLLSFWGKGCVSKN